MELRDLTGGLSTYQEPFAIRDSEAVISRNVSYAKPGSIRTRPGFTRANRTAAVGGAILGIHEYYQEDGTAIRVLKAGTSLYTFTIDSSDVITIGSAIQTGMAAGFKPWFVGFQNKLLVFDKAANYAYDGTNITKLGRSAPTGITLADGGAGSLVDGGAYAYKFTFYSTSLGIESTLSAAVTHTLTAGQTAISVTIPSGVTSQLDSVWDKIRVYRTVTGGSSYLWRSPDVTASFTDTVADGSLGAAAADTDYIQLGGAYAAIEHDGRVWAFIDSALTNVYYSEAGFADRWKSASTLRVGEQDGDKALGFLRIHGRLVVTKMHSLWSLYGSSSSTYQFLPIEGGRGGEAGRAAIVASGIGYVFSIRDYPYRFRGSGVQPIGWKIRDYVQDSLSVTDAENQFIAAWDPKEDAVWFSVRRSGQSVNDRVLVFFTRTQAWSLYELRVSSAALIHRGSDNERRLLFGDDDGYLSWASTGTSDGSPGGTTSGVPQGTSTTTVIETTGGLDTTGDGLEDLFATVRYADGTIESAKITSNTATAITLASALTTAPDTTDVWFVGGVDFQWKSKSFDGDDPWYAKRAQVCRVALDKPSTTRSLDVTVYYDGTAQAIAGFTVSASSGVELGVDQVARRFQVDLRHVDEAAALVVEAIQMPLAGIEASKGARRR